MFADKVSTISSDRLQWQKVFNALVHMLKSQQTQLESLVKERKLLEDRIQIQYDRWVSDVHLLEDQISQMKRDLSKAEMARLLEVAKSDLVVGFKQRESFLYKLKLESTESDLQDFKSWFDYLTYKCSEQKEKSGGKDVEVEKEKGGDGNPKSAENSKEDERRSKILEGEVKKLKRAYEKLTSKNSSEVSALLSERNFVWNQFKKMESDYTSLLKSKRIEVAQANEKIKELLTSMEKLQSSHNEKDETIMKLKAKLAKLEADVASSNREISVRSRELELLRNSRSTLDTPFLNRCTTEPSTTSSESQKDSRNRKKLHLKKESARSQASLDKNSEKECRRSSKRKVVDAVPSSETPRLFSSTFKVPKLKNSSSNLL
ncbi:hypothetical protein BVC80_1831g105 [Macleaya cordata]|uniref:Cytomatrix protein-related n=1 Tax=Macleaya cordata TaxID=56857 RepID=A0A200R7A0_MACCD|nr:hypothetical protein BVC80_1831g105 [Macleaya cordata]